MFLRQKEPLTVAANILHSNLWRSSFIVPCI